MWNNYPIKKMIYHFQWSPLSHSHMLSSCRCNPLERCLNPVIAVQEVSPPPHTHTHTKASIRCAGGLSAYQRHNLPILSDPWDELRKCCTLEIFSPGTPVAVSCVGNSGVSNLSRKEEKGGRCPIQDCSSDL